jgi:DNA-binding NarL/FixJ family response regulator
MNTMAPAPRALVVDDDGRWRTLIAEILREGGWTVTASDRPPEAVSDYQLAVLDVALDPDAPDNRDGLKLLERLSGTRTRCILLSGLGEPELGAEIRQRPHVLGVIHKDSFQREAFVALAHAAGTPAPEPHSRARPRVLIVEDDARWRAVYDEMLAEADYESHYAASYGEARSWLQRAEFALAIVDLHLVSSTEPEANRDGFWLLRAARQRGIPTVVVSALGAPQDIDRAFEEFGVFAFIEKEAFDRRAFSATLADAVAPRAAPLAGPVLLSDLTEREREVLSLLTRGYTNRQIAEALLITPNTVKKHVDHILQKLGVSTRAGAVAAALGANLPPTGAPPPETKWRPT